MIAAAIAFSMALSGVSSGNVTNIDNLPKLFTAACLDGQARLSAGAANPVSFAKLPSILRDRLGRPSSGQVWQLNTSGRAYLYVLNYDSHRGVSPKICGVAADEMNLQSALATVEMRVVGTIGPHGLRGTQWMQPQDGYEATVTTAAEFKVLQINWLNDSDRATALHEVHAVTP
ncbi:MAG: hypothetical protein ABR588_01380 [Sphingomicrobium sp.]|nr:hypothetical protein [Sphingomonadales bacterium]